MHFPLNNPVTVFVFKIKLKLTSRAFNALNNLVSIDPYSLILCPEFQGHPRLSKKRGWKLIPLLTGFLGSSVGKQSACNAGDPGSIPRSGRPAGEGIGYPLQYFWASLVAQLVKNPPRCGRPGFAPWVGKIPWKRERLPTPVF